MEYTVSDLAEHGPQLIGKEITVVGIIFTHWNLARDAADFDEDTEVFDFYYLAPDIDSWEDKSRCIFLDREDLEVSFRDRGVRSRVGGRNGGGLADPCRAVGTLRESSTAPYRFELTDLKSLDVTIHFQFFY